MAREPGRGQDQTLASTSSQTMRRRNWDQACLLQEKQEEEKDPEGQPTASTLESEEWSSSQPGTMACVYIFVCAFEGVRLGVWVMIVMAGCTYINEHELVCVKERETVRGCFGFVY